MKLLLDDVVDVSAINEEGHNCLVTAILNGHRSDTELLVSHNYIVSMHTVLQHLPYSVVSTGEEQCSFKQRKMKPL